MWVFDVIILMIFWLLEMFGNLNLGFLLGIIFIKNKFFLWGFLFGLIMLLINELFDLV